MAVLRFPKEDRMIETEPEIRSELAALGIDYERWSLDRVRPTAPRTRAGRLRDMRSKR